jgi:transposase
MALYCGIDLHSNMSWVVILNEQGKVVLERKLVNEMGRFLNELEPYKDELESIAVESTYNGYWLVDGLQESGYEVRLVNPTKAEQYSGLKYTDDRHDARWLAEMSRLGILPTGYIYPKEQRGIRDLLRKRLRLVRQRSSNLVSLKNGIERQSGERVKTNELKRWGNDYIEAKQYDFHVELSFKSTLKVAEAIDEQVRCIEKVALRLVKQHSKYGVMKTVPGVGNVLAWTILYETGPIERFPSVGDYASYCRGVGSERLSNGKKKGKGNRKNGNVYLAWAFMEAAHFAIRYEPKAKAFYERKLRRSHRIVALKALAHKLARASYYMMRDGVVFDPSKAFG